ncbi:YceI family protein [Paenibacillus sp.]|uniref:YceI family protein n=1 Tax=Paenibacillus sp. TaxID=58172 RepID=UPI003566A1D0
MTTKTVAFSAGVAVVLLAGAYGAYDYFAGNHIEVKEVIPASAPVGGAAATGQAIKAEQIDGKWSVLPASEVYFSVTTSKETVNFVVTPTQGSWELNAADASRTTAEGKIETSALQSGNPQRDNHIKSKDYFDTAQFPEAVFTAKSFDQLPQAWKEGEKVGFQMSGTLQVKDRKKDVTFRSEALYEQGQLRLEGSTVVTFADFGMKNPHTVALDTQNDIQVQLRLVLEKAQG